VALKPVLQFHNHVSFDSVLLISQVIFVRFGHRPENYLDDLKNEAKTFIKFQVKTAELKLEKVEKSRQNSKT
jgi:hypothetical protein